MVLQLSSSRFWPVADMGALVDSAQKQKLRIQGLITDLSDGVVGHLEDKRQRLTRFQTWKLRLQAY
jgi:hypothetical protein